jgi:homoserine O-succinyltransferase
VGKAGRGLKKMPLKIPDTLPAIKILEEENIFVMNESRAAHQDIRPLKIIILNLMPLKISTETDLVRLLSNSPLPKNTSSAHMKEFYRDFDQLKNNKYDGMIITGAPVEHLPFEEVTYWEEMKQILDWAERHVTSSLFICWAAQAALFHYYGIPKYPLKKKMFGVFEHTNSNEKLPIFRGFDDVFYIPHSRHTEIKAKDIEWVESLEIIATSDDAGVSIVKAKNGRQLFITGHTEYSRHTLDTEYRRDKSQNLPIDIPVNYYPDNNPDNTAQMRWKSTANLLFSNWLNYYVYQETPYNLEEIQ